MGYKLHFKPMLQFVSKLRWRELFQSRFRRESIQRISKLRPVAHFQSKWETEESEV